MNGEAVREMRHADIPAVAALHEARGREGFLRPPGPAEDFLARTLLDTPWADPDIRSRVFVDHGEVLGYVGATARRLTLDGRPARAAVGGGFLVAARARGRGIGAALVEHLIAGPQDLTTVDGSAEATRRLWLAAGGHASVQGSIAWRRVLRPGVTVARSRPARRLPPAAVRLVERAAGPLETAARRLGPVRARLDVPDPGLVVEDLTPQALVDHVGPYRLRPDYDTGFVRWMFDLLETQPAPARLVRHIVRAPDRGVLGWYVVMVVPGGTAQVVGLGGAEIAPVVDQLLATCDRAGVAVVEGRLDPGLLEVVRHRRCTLRPDSWTLLHGNGDTGTAVVAMLASSRALFTRFDANWWNGYLLWR